ncbi:MAG: endolytic transglycosylase MltG [bacterium]|nr:endolytic transglycosylase MltG [bacterium]
MKKAKLLSIPPLVLVICALLLFLWWKSVLNPANPKDSSQHVFLITKGQSVAKIAANLEKEGIIKNGFAFRLYTKFTNTDKSIKAGEYKLSPNLALDKLVSTLLKGPSLLWVTVPEGLRKEEVPARFIKALEIKPEVQQKFAADFLEAAKDFEGMLFPETYLFPKDVSASKVVTTMKNTFDTKFTDQMKTDAAKAGMDINEVLTLASIIERETVTDAERPVVAGILLKRMEIGMPLQTDATLQYIVANNSCKSKSVNDCSWWEVPLGGDRTLRSPYNTYTNQGLPPSPIASPGLVSIKAVIYPESSDYLYYIHDNDGKIRYGKTLDEHNSNVQKYLR